MRCINGGENLQAWQCQLLPGRGVKQRTHSRILISSHIKINHVRAQSLLLSILFSGALFIIFKGTASSHAVLTAMIKGEKAPAANTMKVTLFFLHW